MSIKDLTYQQRQDLKERRKAHQAEYELDGDNTGRTRKIGIALMFIPNSLVNFNHWERVGSSRMRGGFVGARDRSVGVRWVYERESVCWDQGSAFGSVR